MKGKQTAGGLLRAGNIASASHCMTRLRLVLNDEGKANDDVLKAIKGVKSVIKQGGQYQVVIVTMFCSNICQGAASLGAGMKSKNPDTRSEGLACAISAIVAGVTEPDMYGINMRYVKPMIGAVCGAGLAQKE